MDPHKDEAAGRPRYRTVFVSDVHLGTRDCQAQRLRKFLTGCEMENLILVGDIVDLWAMRRRWYWPQEHNDVLQKVLKKARHGTRVVYIPGNHDEHFRQFVGLDFGGIAIRRDLLHVTADGRRLLVVHGDEFDALIKLGLLYRMGDWAYGILLLLNRWMNHVRRWFGLGYWSLAAAIKRKVKNAMRYVGGFEQSLAHRAREQGADGVVCGHIHKPDIRVIDGIHYYNDGDWVDSCTALVEHLDGRMELLEIGRAPDGAQEPLLPFEVPAEPSRATAGLVSRPYERTT
jgi:UDP-2,3-diacylglucosamine pyrophosphatase LpxH